jgi:hypothetical protein
MTHFGLTMAVSAALTLLPSGDLPQNSSGSTDPLSRLGFLIGRWEGAVEGQPGNGTARREYTRALNSRFIRAVHRGEYPPQEKNPKGEIHEDEGFFSYDKARKRVVFRQFHVEGFVNTYLEEADSSSSKIVFTTETIENIPAGFRARETYLVEQGPDAFEEVFEIAEPGRPFELYSRTRLTRIK